MSERNRKHDVPEVESEEQDVEEMIADFARAPETKRMLCVAQSVKDDALCLSYSEKDFEETEHLALMIAEFVLATKNETDKSAEEFIREIIEAVNNGGVSGNDD
jgi:ketosteroid isomerase-like protein